MKNKNLTILFPGRHHMLTKFQHDYLSRAVKDGIDGKKISRIIFAVTSADHENTRRNPTPLYLRAMAIGFFAADIPCETKIYPIKDVKYTDKFASYILRQIFYQSGEEITPENTILACSTPPVIRLFKELGFKNMPVELVDEVQDKYSALRPHGVIDLLVKSGAAWRERSAEWRKYASRATQDIYDEYNLGNIIIETFNDTLLSADAEITETRDYLTYAQGMDVAVRAKFEDIGPFVVEGKIVDVGCATGSLIQLLAKEFKESDIIGIEATRKFYEYCKAQDYQNPFVFFYRRNIKDQSFKENSINTFIYSSVFHEVYSYLGEESLRETLRKAYVQLKFGGRIIIRDVVGPENPNDFIYMALNKTDGNSSGDLAKLSTHARFLVFAKDFKPRKIQYEIKDLAGQELIKIRRVDAYEYISKKDYVDNWKSEMNEEFGFYSFSKWAKQIEDAGFSVVKGSHPFKNSHIIDSKYKDKVTLYSLEMKIEDYPPTNMILVGEKTFSKQ